MYFLLFVFHVKQNFQNHVIEDSGLLIDTNNLFGEQSCSSNVRVTANK